MSGARTGDWVRARKDRRETIIVEGVLFVRYIPGLNYVQVHVAGHPVEPDSVEVVTPRFMPPEEVHSTDPMMAEPGRRSIDDLDQARAEGLLPPIRVREGGTWSDMWQRLDRVVAPLLDAGWRREGWNEEDSWEYGDSVSYELERAGEQIELELELYEHGHIDVCRNEVEQEVDLDEEPTGALFHLHVDASEEWRIGVFDAAGWLGSP